MAFANAKVPDVIPDVSPDRLGEFDSVRLLEDLPGEDVMWFEDEETADRLVAGATGAIVHAHTADGPFEVEFFKPAPALATVRKDQLVRR